MRFCTRCGGELLKESETKFTCTQCRVEQFRNPKGAVAIIFFTPDNKVLLARRAHEPAKGKLDPVGVFLDLGENFETALYRELEEETGLKKADITDVSYLGSAHDYYLWEGENESIVSAYFTARLNPGKTPRADDDVSSFETFDLENIPKNEFAWPGLEKMINKLSNET